MIKFLQLRRARVELAASIVLGVGRFAGQVAQRGLHGTGRASANRRTNARSRCVCWHCARNQAERRTSRKLAPRVSCILDMTQVIEGRDWRVAVSWSTLVTRTRRRHDSPVWDDTKGFPGEGPQPVEQVVFRACFANCASWNSLECDWATSRGNHVVMLQETRLTDGTRDLASLPTFSQTHRARFTTGPFVMSEGGGRSGGVAVLWAQALNNSALPLHDESTTTLLAHRNRHSFGWRHIRVARFVYLGQLKVAWASTRGNVHDVSETQAMFTRCVAALAGAGTPFVIAGDWNCTPEAVAAWIVELCLQLAIVCPKKRVDRTHRRTIDFLVTSPGLKARLGRCDEVPSGLATRAPVQCEFVLPTRRAGQTMAQG
jgi:hypothetical protein